MIRTILSAAVLATCLAGAPAHAGGSVSLSFQQINPRGDDMLQTGLRLYGLAKGITSGRIRQKGSGNVAGLAQNGRGNLGIVHQKGRSHEGTIRQNGDGNAYGLFQFGRGTSGHVVQNGDHQAGATIQFGW
jgi:hypothetical protein